MKKQRTFLTNVTEGFPYQRQPQQVGLYDAAYEHDACGVGMLVNIHGEKSHDIVESALKVLENMRYRGAEGADNKTGDGAGIMLAHIAVAIAADYNLFFIFIPFLSFII